jgi:hypothetical protein
VAVAGNCLRRAILEGFGDFFCNHGRETFLIRGIYDRTKFKFNRSSGKNPAP